MLNLDMKRLKSFVLYVMIVAVLFYLMSNYFPNLWFQLNSEYSNELLIYLFVAVVSWLINYLLRNLLNLLTKPISAITFWLFSLFLNFILLYVFEQLINFLELWIEVSLWSVLQVFIISIILSLVAVLIKKK